MTSFRKATTLPVPCSELFAWHARPGAFERLTPPWQSVRLVRHEGISDGDEAVLELRKGPLRRRWVARHLDFVEGRQFADVQVSGPFASWRHVHRFTPAGEAAATLEDEIEYELPGGRLGAILAGGYARRTLERTFAFRHGRTGDDVLRHATAPPEPRRVAITGASGTIGRALSAFLTSGGHRVDPLVRRAPAPGTTEIGWDPDRGEIDIDALEGVDAVFHLSGARIDRRWTRRAREEIADSRVATARLLAGAIARLERPPQVFVSASAVGYYGGRGDELLDEQAPAGNDFLAEVCREWEAAARPAAAAGVRVVNLRAGATLTNLLERMALFFRLGVGGRVGDGRQWLSWVDLDDLVGAYHHALFTENLTGPVNVSSPQPVRSDEFARTLGRVLRRPAALPAPGALLRLVFGELADVVLLSGQRVATAKLEASGFRFLHPELEPALRRELGR